MKAGEVKLFYNDATGRSRRNIIALKLPPCLVIGAISRDPRLTSQLSPGAEENAGVVFVFFVLLIYMTREH